MTRNGFTLVELVVALFIFGLLAAAGVALLGFGVRAQASAGQRLEGIAEDRRMVALLAGDLAQVLSRATRNVSGETRPAFAGTTGAGAAPFMSYVRAGWTSPGDAPRAGVQRVELALASGRLERRGYPRLDGDAAPAVTVLARDVTGVALRYRDRTGAWRSGWSATRVETLPRAVEMIVGRRDRPQLLVNFLVGTPYP